MNTQEAILSRKSTRAYKSEQISDEALENIIKAACASPVAMAQYQSLHITIIQNEDVIKHINELTSEMFAKKTGVKKNTDFGAKTMILVSSTHTELPLQMEYANVGIVVENMVIAATGMGIDSVILGGAPRIIAEDNELIKALGIPDGFVPVLGAVFGYAVENAPAKSHAINVNRI